VNQRALASNLKVNRKTVASRLKFLGQEAERKHEKFLRRLSEKPNKLSLIQFDDMETSVHSKCKPVSIAIAVHPLSRKILSLKVSEMPAKGRLVKKALFLYGPRQDRRPEGWRAMFREITPLVRDDVMVVSDENPHYPKYVKEFLPNAHHIQTKGRNARMNGQGELKTGGYDPIFTLNLSCAQIRDRVNVLVRETWSTTKKIESLQNHLNVYLVQHNEVVIYQNLTRREKAEKIALVA
jgi:hypothetical protein